LIYFSPRLRRGVAQRRTMSTDMVTDPLAKPGAESELRRLSSRLPQFRRQQFDLLFFNQPPRGSHVGQGDG
jgi:hypothetical protein